MSLNLLVTAAGTGTGYAYALAQSRWFPRVMLVTADTNPAELVSASLFSRQHLVLLATYLQGQYKPSPTESCTRSLGTTGYWPVSLTHQKLL